jgi:general secretion pathway protein A
LDDRQPKRPLADDPTFLASLSELDRGLTSREGPGLDANPVQAFPESQPPPARPPLAPRGISGPTPGRITAQPVAARISIAAPPPPLAAQSAPTPSAASLPEPPPWLPPTAFAALSAASAALSAAFELQPSGPSVAPSSVAAPPAAALAQAATAGSARTLLDIFPPTVSRESTAPVLPAPDSLAPPRIAAVEPPRVAVRPRTVPAPAQARGGVTYESFYGLDTKPFAAPADPRFLYHGSAHDRVLQDLLSSVSKHDAIAVMTGPAGMGKTIVCRALIDQLDRRTVVSFVSDEVPASPEHLLKKVLVDFGVVSAEEAASGGLASASHDDLSRALRDFLASLAALQATALLIVDDAHKLPADVFRELRTLSDGAAAGHALQLLLVGEPRLTRDLRSNELRALDERAALRVELGPLEEEEVAGYVAHRLAVAGSGERVSFSDRAIHRIFALSRGVPGVVNRICDRSLVLGHQASESLIDGDLVEEAAQHLGLVSADEGGSLRDRVMVAVLMIVLMLAGAAGAGWVFREPLGRALAQFSIGRR